jgi:hypothetical protein
MRVARNVERTVGPRLCRASTKFLPRLCKASAGRVGDILASQQRVYFLFLSFENMHGGNESASQRVDE